MKRGGRVEPPRRGRVRRRGSGPRTGVQTTAASKDAGGTKAEAVADTQTTRFWFLVLAKIRSTRRGRVEEELHVRFLRELDWCPRPFSHGQNGEQLPNQMVLEPYLASPHVPLGWNAVRSTDTRHHGGAPARQADPAASAVWAPHKLDLGRLLGPQVTPGPNGGQGPNWPLLPPLIS